MRHFYDGSAPDDESDDTDGPRGDGTPRDDELDDVFAGEDDPDGADNTWGDEDDDAELGDDDPELEADFPRGDGTADTAAVASCPYCGELNELAVDPGGGSSQSYVEDCHVCCRPWRVTVAFDRAGQALVQLDPAD